MIQGPFLGHNGNGQRLGAGGVIGAALGAIQGREAIVKVAMDV